MALTLINGITGVAAISINSLLYDCFMGRWRGQATKQYFSQVTFCSDPGWRDELIGLKAVDIVSDGFLGHGVAQADPLLDFGTVAGVACVWTAAAGCTISGTFHIEKSFGVAALGLSEFGISARSKGAIASTWNTTT